MHLGTLGAGFSESGRRRQIHFVNAGSRHASNANTMVAVTQILAKTR
ncbi:hypothetical protein ACLB1R_00360 [Escherichia coli]